MGGTSAGRGPVSEEGWQRARKTGSRRSARAFGPGKQNSAAQSRRRSRQNEIKQVNLHNSKEERARREMVNIGPTDADYEQNGSFTGHVRDSGRARNLLFHPDYPDTVFFLTSGGGLWRTDNWSASSPTWTGADRQHHDHGRRRRRFRPQSKHTVPGLAILTTSC
jgi:hypothetical protein